VVEEALLSETEDEVLVEVAELVLAEMEGEARVEVVEVVLDEMEDEVAAIVNPIGSYPQGGVEAILRRPSLTAKRRMMRRRSLCSPPLRLWPSLKRRSVRKRLPTNLPLSTSMIPTKSETGIGTPLDVSRLDNVVS
jgi:hypothetical protein